MNFARSLQQELEKIKPRIVQLVASLAGPRALSSGSYLSGSNGDGDIDEFGTRGGRGVAETLSSTLRRLAEGRMLPAVSSLMGSRVGSMPSLAARAQQYALAMQEVVADAVHSTKSLNTGSGGSGTVSHSSRSKEGRRGKSLGGGGSSSHDGLRASLDELCSLHDELGAIGRLQPDASAGSENINRLMASIQMCRADTEARLELAVAALADPGDPGAADAHAAELPTERATVKRSRLGEPYNPKTRRAPAGAAAASPSPGEDDRVEDEGSTSATAVTAPPATGSRVTRYPYVRGGDLYVPRPPRRLREEESPFAMARPSGGSTGRGSLARWERQVHEYNPMLRRRQLAAEEITRQQSATGMSRSVRAAAAAAAAMVADISEGGSQSTSPAPASSTSAPLSSISPANIFFPPSTHTRGGGAPGQPVGSLSTSTFRFGRTAPAASPPPQAGQPPVFPGGGSIAPGGGGRRQRQANRRNSRVEEAERLLRGMTDGDADPFLSLPQLPLPASHLSGRGGPSTVSAATTTSSATSTSGAGGGGVVMSAGGTSASMSTLADSAESTTANGQASSNYPPEIVELAELYCGRCQDLSVRLSSAVADRDALAASTMDYLRSGRAVIGGISAGSGTGTGSGYSRGGRANASGGTVVSAAIGALRWKNGRGSSIWGGDGGHPGEAAIPKQPCCAKCKEEVHVHADYPMMLMICQNEWIGYSISLVERHPNDARV